MRVAKHRLTMLEDRGAGAPVEAAFAGAIVVGVAALLASSSLASAGTKPLSHSIKAEAGALARKTENAIAASHLDTGEAIEPSVVEVGENHVRVETAAASIPTAASIRHSAPKAVHAVIRMELPKTAEPRVAEPTPILSAVGSGPVLRMALPESIVVSEISQVPSTRAKADYQRPEPVLSGSAAPMVVVARIDLPPARPIDDELPQPEPAAASQVALVEPRATGSVMTPVSVELNLADKDRPAAPANKSEPVLVASIDDIERQLSFAAGFDLRNLDRIAADDVPAAGSIEVTKTVLANGRSVGAVPLRIAPDSTVSIRLGDLVELFRGQMNSRNFAALDASVRANTFVSFRRLRAAGIGVRYDPVLDSISMSVET